MASNPPQGTESVSRTMEENVRIIKALEESALHRRSPAERVSEWITSTAGRGPVLFAHFLWFVGWAAVNVHAVPFLRPFDPFPFPRLTALVSLEAIFLALFVLASQNRLATQNDRRAHLDLQINLLAEQESTKMLQMLRSLCRHQGLAEATDPEVLCLERRTEPEDLLRELKESLPDNC